MMAGKSKGITETEKMITGISKAAIRRKISSLRRIYLIRLLGRCCLFLFCVFLYRYHPEELVILQENQFFQRFSILHLIWGIWVIDMVHQIIPAGKQISLGSQKLFGQYFKSTEKKWDSQQLRQYIKEATKLAYRVFVIWAVLIVVIGILYDRKILDDSLLFMISVAFYVCDLICVLIWCPFRLIMKNRCCTTCRIFNWDHLMMFTPMLFVKGFYSYSLLFFAFAVWMIWELAVIRYPERFWEHSNEALKCSRCTDKVCTQYCQKPR